MLLMSLVARALLCWMTDADFGEKGEEGRILPSLRILVVNFVQRKLRAWEATPNGEDDEQAMDCAAGGNQICRSARFQQDCCHCDAFEVSLQPLRETPFLKMFRGTIASILTRRRQDSQHTESATKSDGDLG